MDIELIEMAPEEARERLKAYRTSIHMHADAEYQAAAAGYEALGMGTPLIQLSEVIRDAPVDEHRRPMLAVARADQRQVKVTAPWTGQSLVYTTLPHDLISGAGGPGWGNYLQRWPGGERAHRFEVRGGTPERYGYALVPMVPPEALQAVGGRASALSGHLILWEVEQWHDRAHGARPDYDPLLLKRLHGDLCAVVAAWDLTPVERAIMAGRARGDS